MPGVLFGNDVTVTSEGALVSDLNVETGGTVVGNPPTIFHSTAGHHQSVHELQATIHSTNNEIDALEKGGGNKNKEHEISKYGDDNEGSAIAFNLAAIIINILKLPSVVSVFVGWHYFFSWCFGFENMNAGTRVVVSVASFLCGTFAIATFVAFLARAGVTSMKIGYTSYYTVRFISWWYCRWLNRFVSGILLYPFHGSRIYNAWLGLVGAKIGKGCFMDPSWGGFLEIDNMHIGQGCIILTPNVHGHFVDHNKLQFAPVRIGSQCRANIGSTIMPFSTIKDRITLLSQCTTTKGQVLDKQGSFYMGNMAFQLHTDDLNIPSPAIAQDDASLSEEESSVDEEKDIWSKKSRDERLRIVVHGQQAFGLAVLERLCAQGENVVAVCSAPTKAGMPEDPLVLFAKSKNIPVHKPKSWRTQESLELMHSFEADICLMAYVLLFVPEAILNTPKFGTFAYHPSLLPAHRGPSSINWPIAMGKKETGLSIFWPNDGMDEGPLMMQKTCAIGPNETLGDIYFRKLFPMGVDAMLEGLELVKKGVIVKTEQKLEEGSYEGWFKKEASALDWSQPIVDVYNVIRGSNPSPGAWTTFSSSEIKIFDCELLLEEYCHSSVAALGTITDFNEKGLIVQGNGGKILIKTVQSTGGIVKSEKWASSVDAVVGSFFGSSSFDGRQKALGNRISGVDLHGRSHLH